MTEMFCVLQAVWRGTGAPWSPVWTACPASWSGSPPTPAACCRPPTAPVSRQRNRPVRRRPRRPPRSPAPPPARTPTWSIKSYRPAGTLHPVTWHRSTHLRWDVWKLIPARKNSVSLTLLTGPLLGSPPHRTAFINRWSLIFYINFYRFYSKLHVPMKTVRYGQKLWNWASM